MAFLNLTRPVQGYYLEINYDQFLSHSLQFTIY